jgi:hypothetical protein
LMLVSDLLVSSALATAAPPSGPMRFK